MSKQRQRQQRSGSSSGTSRKLDPAARCRGGRLLREVARSNGGRLTPSVARRSRLDVYTYSDARSGDTPQFQPSEDRIGLHRARPARPVQSLYFIRSNDPLNASVSCHLPRVFGSPVAVLNHPISPNGACGWGEGDFQRTTRVAEYTRTFTFFFRKPPTTLRACWSRTSSI